MVAAHWQPDVMPSWHAQNEWPCSFQPARRLFAGAFLPMCFFCPNALAQDWFLCTALLFSPLVGACAPASLPVLAACACK